MIRVVLDTNVIVSAYLNQDGLPFLILKLVLLGQNGHRGIQAHSLGH